jgi:hypothetical protein
MPSLNTGNAILSNAIAVDSSYNVGIGGAASGSFKLQVTGATNLTGVLTLGSTISNGTFTYTLPSATGTLALTSALSGYLPLTGGTLTGALSGTTASFNSGGTSNAGFFQINDGTTTLGNSFTTVHRNSNDGNGRFSLTRWQVQNTSGLEQSAFIGAQAVTGASNYSPNLILGVSTGVSTYSTYLTIASTGAATFSSSVTATQFATGSASATYPFNSISAAGTQALLNSTRTGGGGIILQNNGADSVYLGTANWAGVSGFGTSTTDICLAAAANSSAIVFATGTSSTERMRITSGGDLLWKKDAATVGLVGVRFGWPSGDVYSTITPGINTYHVYDATNSVYRFYVGANGTINATNTTISAISDVRLKENIVDLQIGLDAIMALRPRQFDWKKESGNSGKNIRGFIAQEFEEIFPDLIDESINESPEGEAPYKQIRQDLIPILVKAMQQQQAQIQELKTEIEELKAIVATK